MVLFDDPEYQELPSNIFTPVEAFQEEKMEVHWELVPRVTLQETSI